MQKFITFNTKDMKNLTKFAFAAVIAMLTFTACDNAKEPTFLDTVLGRYHITTYNEYNELVWTDVVLKEAGDNKIIVRLPKYIYKEYSFGDVEILCPFTEEEDKIYFSGTANVTATRADGSNAEISIDGNANGKKINVEIKIETDGMSAKIKTSGSYKKDQNKEETAGDKKEETVPLATGVVGEWKAIRYDGYSLPSSYIMTMKINADGSYQSYTFIPGEDGDEDEETTIDGSWRLDGNKFVIINNGYDYAYFYVSKITETKLHSYIDATTTIWSKQ